MSLEVNQIQESLNHTFDKEMGHLFATVPQAQRFHQGEMMDRDYYVRHLHETLLRIHINNEVDAYCLHKLTKNQQLLAGKLATYLVEEYGHDKLFQKDLRHFGLSDEEIENTSPFITTHMLMDYMKGAIDRDGAIPTIVWNYFVEHYSDLYNQNITTKAAEVFGSDKVSGSQGHLDIDEAKDHVGLMTSLLTLGITNQDELKKANQYMKTFIYLIGLYFDELYHSTNSERLQ